MPSEDGRIIREILGGDINRYADLVKKYLPKVRMFVRQRVRNPDDCEDIIQETFVRTYKNLNRFDRSKSLYPYLLTTASSQIAQFFRDNKAHSPLHEELVGQREAEVDETPEILGKLSGDYKKVIGWQLEGFTYEEMAVKLRKPLNTIKTLVRRAKLQLKESYG